MSAAPVISSSLKLKLKVTAGPHQGEIYSLENALTKVGRGEDNDIKLVNDGRISRNHLEITYNNQQFKFKNVSQKNFVMIDGRVMEEGFLMAGQQMQVGETIFEVYSDGPALVSNNKPSNEVNSALTVRVELQPVVTPAIIRPAPLQKIKSNDANVLKPMGAVAPTPLRPMPEMSVPPRKSTSRRQAPSGSGNRTQFYGILLLVVGIVLFVLMRPSTKKEIKTFRTSQQVEFDLLQSSDEKKRLQERLEVMQTTTAKRSQENLIKGFRDYQQGNYARARDNFQVVLNLDPDNALAKRYYHLSKIKFDELLQFHMLQGLRYRDKRNYRLCRSSFQSALIMIQNNQQHPKYREIRNFFDECDLALEGRF